MARTFAAPKMTVKVAAPAIPVALSRRPPHRGATEFPSAGGRVHPGLAPSPPPSHDAPQPRRLAGATMALTFYYDFTSSYSYLAVMRMEDAAAEAGVEVVWRPVPPGPDLRRRGARRDAEPQEPGEGGLHVATTSRGAPRTEGCRSPSPRCSPSAASPRAVQRSPSATPSGRPSRARCTAACSWRGGIRPSPTCSPTPHGRRASTRTGIAAGAQDPAAKAALFAAVDEGEGTRPLRRPILRHDGWRALLGRRAARGRAVVGGVRPAGPAPEPKRSDRLVDEAAGLGARRRGARRAPPPRPTWCR